MSRKHCCGPAIKSIGVVQLFHELKLLFPKIPDTTIRKSIKESNCDFRKSLQILEYEEQLVPRAQIYPNCLRGLDCHFAAHSPEPNRCLSNQNCDELKTNIVLKVDVRFDSGKRFFKAPRVIIQQHSDAKTTVSFQIQKAAHATNLNETKSTGTQKSMMIDLQIREKDKLLIQFKVEKHQLECMKKQISLIETSQSRNDSFELCKHFLIDNIENLRNLCEKLTFQIHEINEGFFIFCNLTETKVYNLKRTIDRSTLRRFDET